MVSLLLLLLPLMGPAGSTTVVIPSHQGDLRRFEVRSGDELRHQTPPHTPRDAHGHGLPHPTSHAPAHPHSAAEHNGSGSHVPAAPAMQEYGFRFPRVASYKTWTKMMESPMDKSCIVATDCTKKCVESCHMAAVDVKCATHQCKDVCRMKSCSAEVSTLMGTSTGNCQYECDTTCIMDCRLEEENRMLEKLTSCVHSRMGACVEQCTAEEGHDHSTCHSLCVDKSRADCTASASRGCLKSCGGHVCSREQRCKCPFISKADSMCSSHTWLRSIVPHSAKYCFQSPFEARFRQSKYGEWHTPRIAKSLLHDASRNALSTYEAHRQHVENHPSAAKLSHHPAPDLADLGDFSTCAVIGSSGSLTGSGMGHAIDNHTAVIRFNDAPTRGYESDVGAKTTLRIQNNMYCGFCENESEVLFPYTISTVEKFCKPREGHPTCPIFRSSTELRNFVTRFYEPLLQKFAHNAEWYTEEDTIKGEGAGEKAEWAFNIDDVDDTWSMHQRKLLLLDTATQVVNGQQVPLKDISAGMTGILLAMHMCHEVDVYGFGQAETYYYPKLKRADRAWGTIHYWPLEHHCMDTYKKYASRVNFHS